MTAREPKPAIQRAVFVNYLGPPLESLHAARLCIVKLWDGRNCQAYIKSCPAREITVEVVCALLGQAADLPVSNPLLVTMPDGGTCFGSVDLEAPPFRHFLNQDPAVRQRLQAWPELAPAACFDEWISNPDRHMENLLHDGLKSFWLIDHGYAAAADQKPSEACGRNILFEIAKDATEGKPPGLRLRPTMLGVMQAWHTISIKSIMTPLRSPPFTALRSVINFVATRQLKLPALVALRLPKSQEDLFDGNTSE